ATIALQKEGGAQSSGRKEILAINNLIENPEDSFVQAAHIDITDTGSGIAPDEIDLIWNRYYRTKETHKRAVIGSGLGLNIVQTILERHQVPYGVRSEVGHGTTFWFELPLSPSSDDEPSSSDPC
ncbi:MAG: ATP-binding protein, partial [Clostridia bacterium]|nr:ATP-binding protein [Clostridia bacterium]